MTKCLCTELAPRGIRVNSVNPGLINTEFMMRAGLTSVAFSQAMEFAKKNQPLGRAADPDEVARVILFLAETNRFS